MNLTGLLLKSNLPVRELSEEESKKLKMTLLEMFRDIKKACEEENLTVMLGGGTCLGAVRHKGFIPWDDDLDLNMLRCDYEKFPKALEKHFPNKYNLVGPEVSDNYSLPFIKIEKRGTVIKTVYEFEDENPAIGIDLFPIENIPDGKLPRLLHGFWNNFYQYVAVCVKLWKRRNCPVTKLLLSTSEGKKSLKIRFFIGRLFSFRTYQKWYEKCDEVAKKYKKKRTRCVTVPSGRCHYFGEIQELSDIIPPKECMFETENAFIYNNVEKYLLSLYGDYMQIPPIEKREKHFIVDINFGDI
ncbi:LicD family protein [Treponema pectinovorum]|uniref:LicD family protein n=1 Tax=Treponema pectinovorum TaxID=164 RepID=UPI0011CBCBA9|nr:LicD family protein [Treponema pectinovorum]